MLSRRNLLKLSAAASITSVAPSDAMGAEPIESLQANPLCVFTKPFNSLTAQQIAEQTSRLGLQGIEAPIRSGGHIEPDAVVDELPRFVEALREHDQEIVILASDINDANDITSQKVLETAARLGIRYYRMVHSCHPPF